MGNDDDLVRRAAIAARRAYALTIMATAFLAIGGAFWTWGTPAAPFAHERGLYLPVPGLPALVIGIALSLCCTVGAAVLAATDVALLRQVQTLDRAREMIERSRRHGSS